MPLLNSVVCIFRFVELVFSFFNDSASTEFYTLSLHDALPIYRWHWSRRPATMFVYEVPRLQHRNDCHDAGRPLRRSEEHTSELQSLRHLVCRLLLEKKN